MEAISIKDILQSSRLSFFNLEKDTPLAEWLHCPACDMGLETICVLTNGSDQHIRYGLCHCCGYMGYMDRPTGPWMIDFYSKDWDKAFPKTIAEIQRGTILPGPGIKPSRYLAASLIDRIQSDKQKPVCEMGSGYGEVLKYFRDNGFQNVIGIENSKHRADLVSKALGLNILQGEFENQKIQDTLSQQKPIGLIFSHHVLEHVYDPARVIACIASLQENGDYVILSLPNADGEHINYALLYLVHLHSFTKESLELLLNKYGYEIIINNSPDDMNTIIAARKTPNPQRKFQSKQDYATNISGRIRKGFSLDHMHGSGPYRLYWGQDREKDFSKILPTFSNRFLQNIDWYVKNKIAFIHSRFLKKFTLGYTMLVRPTTTPGKCFEIQFPDKIKFLIK